MRIVGSLSKQLNTILEKADMSNTNFTEDELNSITTISLSKRDLPYVEFFKNVETLNLDSFPSVNNDDILLISQKLNKVKNLKIKEQNALFKLNLNGFNSLKTICLIHNDNLIEIEGLNYVDRFTFYDNKDFSNIRYLVDFLISNTVTTMTLDIAYYIDMVRILFNLKADVSILNRIAWIESIGLRKYITYDYTNNEIESIFKYISLIAAQHTYKTDDDIHKFAVLYSWMINNIKFVNEDDPEGENLNLISNVNKVFSYGKAGRLSFAKAFQLLLSFANIKSSVVYSMGATDVIGYYNGERVCSLLGDSDYALLRVTLDGKEYYCDIAWDSLIKFHGFYDKLRLFLFSKDELKVRHRLVGEGNIENTYSYHGDDVDDLIKFANDRCKEVKELFNDLERLQPDIDSNELNIALIKLQIHDVSAKLDTLEIDSQEYKNSILEMTKLEEQMDSLSADLVRLGSMKEGIVKSYSNMLIDRYLGNISNANIDNLISELEKLEKILLVPEYMLNLYKICLK